MDLVPKAIRDSIGFAFLRSVIGLENSRHSLKCKTKTNHDQERILSCHDLVTRVFPRFWQFFLTSSSHWFSKGSSHGTVMIILVLVLHQSIEKRSKLHRKCFSWTHVFCVCFAEYTGCVLLHVGLCSVATCCFSCP